MLICIYFCSSPEHMGENHALEELLQQLEGNAQHLYEADRIIATPHMSEVQRSPPPPPPAVPPTPPQHQLSVERYRHGGKNIQQMADLYASDGTIFARGTPSPRTPQELAERSCTWLQDMLPDYQAQLEATRNNIARLQTELEASRTQELKLLDDMGRIQEYLKFVQQQQKW
ncbi:hypothetical protein RI129_002045 [Pyrocoelia pectoralis]|uniref:Uncharacterized protein n=1 Tax=Pyrocoelia pectoralis TaxID=417401 RepID=A0AAN7ZSN1_9COLE